LEEILRPQHRLIVCIEEPNTQWNATNNPLNYRDASESLKSVLHKIDPHSKRTVWVQNKLHSALDTFTSSESVNKYFAKTDSPTTYWTTLLSSKERQNCKTQVEFLNRLDQVRLRDERALNILNLESKYNDRLGINNLRNFVLTWSWNRYYQNEVPRIFKTITQRKQEISKEISITERKMVDLNLRSVAAQYVNRYLETCQGVLSGNSRGNPALNGETMKEEVDEQFFSSTEWDIPSNQRIPLQDSKIYGGQQFERLFFEFKSITSHLKPNLNEMNSLPSISDKKFFYSACESSGFKIEELLSPIVDQLIERVCFIMKRVPIIVDAILSKKEAKPNPKQQLPIDGKLFLPVVGHLKDLFNSYIERTSKSCRSQCMEEFYSTKTIVWSMSQSISIEGTKKNEQEIYTENL